MEKEAAWEKGISIFKHHFGKLKLEYWNIAGVWSAEKDREMRIRGQVGPNHTWAHL